MILANNYYSKMNTLPIEIVRDTIIPFTYCPISPELKKDLLSFHKTNDKIRKIYALQFPPNKTIPDGDGDLAWLSNDITRFINNDVPLLSGYVTFYKEVFKRLYMNKNKTLQNVKLPNLYNYENFNDIKTTLGLLTPEERDKLEVFLGANL